jgi:hypothetical protein
LIPFLSAHPVTIKPGLSMAHLSLAADQAGLLPVENAAKMEFKRIQKLI